MPGIYRHNHGQEPTVNPLTSIPFLPSGLETIHSIDRLRFTSRGSEISQMMRVGELTTTLVASIPVTLVLFQHNRSPAGKPCSGNIDIVDDGSGRSEEGVIPVGVGATPVIVNPLEKIPFCPSILVTTTFRTQGVAAAGMEILQVAWSG